MLRSLGLCHFAKVGKRLPIWAVTQLKGTSVETCNFLSKITSQEIQSFFLIQKLLHNYRFWQRKNRENF